MTTIDAKIKNIDKVICRHLDNSEVTSRGAVSQDILSHIRNFIEHVMLKFYAKGEDIDNSYKNICDAISFVQARADLKMLYKFHEFIQIVASHYTLDEENSEVRPPPLEFCNKTTMPNKTDTMMMITMTNVYIFELFFLINCY